MPIVEALQKLASISEQQPALMAAALATVLSSQKPLQTLQLPEIQREQAIFNFQNENENPIVRKKPSKKLIAAIAWLLKNDPKLEMKVVDVVSAVGVSLGTVDAARKAIRSGKYSEILAM